MQELDPSGRIPCSSYLDFVNPDELVKLAPLTVERLQNFGADELVLLRLTEAFQCGESRGVARIPLETLPVAFDRLSDLLHLLLAHRSQPQHERELRLLGVRESQLRIEVVGQI